VVPGELTRAAIAAQPEWLGRLEVDLRLPDGDVLFTGCGTSFHAAMSGGRCVQALELVLAPERRAADLLVLVSHEGETPLTLEAARAFGGPKWCVTGAPEAPIPALCDEVIVTTPELERSYCHTVSYTCAVAAIAAMRGEDISFLRTAVAEALADPFPISGHERWLVAGAGPERATAEEAVLKLREGAFVAAEAHHTEQLLHGYLAAVDKSVRAFVLEGEGRAAERARDAVAALTALGCDVTLVPTRHPVVDIVRFQQLTADIAADRGRNPDLIRRDDERWKRARDAYA
jgi:glutamine---fructose-6-phosphate transaminase (isomerizing)